MWDIVKTVISASPQLCHVPAPSLCWYKHSQIWTIHTNHFFLSWVSFNDQQFPNPVCHGTNNYKKKYIEKASSDSIWIIVGWTVNRIPRSLYYHNWGDGKPHVAGKKFWSPLKKINMHAHLTSLHCLLYLLVLLWKSLELIPENDTNSASQRTIEMNESQL